MDARKLAKNVSDFLSKASEEVCKIQHQRWAEEVYIEMVESKISSPIEDLFYIALCAQCLAEYVDVNPDPRTRKDGTHYFPDGLVVVPQFKIGRYKADFLIQKTEGYCSKINVGIIVELDGHDFHDRDKQQRSYEKRRDRDFQRAGYKVVHFTGSNVVADPFAVAFEVLQMSGCLDYSERSSYDPQNPLGKS